MPAVPATRADGPINFALAPLVLAFEGGPPHNCVGLDLGIVKSNFTYSSILLLHADREELGSSACCSVVLTSPSSPLQLVLEVALVPLEALAAAAADILPPGRAPFCALKVLIHSRKSLRLDDTLQVELGLEPPSRGRAAVTLLLRVAARIMGKKQGTPALRPHVSCEKLMRAEMSDVETDYCN